MQSNSDVQCVKCGCIEFYSSCLNHIDISCWFSFQCLLWYFCEFDVAIPCKEEIILLLQIFCAWFFYCLECSNCFQTLLVLHFVESLVLLEINTQP